MERNIKLIYIISSLMWMRFFIPVLALFYIASQVSLNEFTIIMSIFALTTLLLEIPSGVIADILGKKKTLLISRFMYIIEIFILAFFDGFWLFLIAKVISGIGVSLSSGTDQALLYDTLKKLNREKEHKKISGDLYTITNISMAITFIIGSFLFSINNKLPAIVSLPLITIGFILTFFIIEPYENNKKLNFQTSYLHLKEGLKYFGDNQFLKYLVFYSLPIATTISIILSLSSAYFKEILIPISMIGLVAFLASMITAFASRKSDSIENIFGEEKSLLTIQFLSIIAIILMSLMVNYFGFLFYLIIAFISGFFSVVINHYTNKHIETSHRATMLSIKNLFNNIGVFTLFPIIGLIQKKSNLANSFTFLYLFLILYCIILYFYFRKINVFK